MFGSFRESTPSCSKINIYTCKLDSLQAGNLCKLCQSKGFDRYNVAYSAFAFRGDGINIIFYESGKLVIQGKCTEDFVKFELEPRVTCSATLGYDEVIHKEWFEEHAGMDESGKGDLFGPLVTACVIAGGDTVRQWIKDGVKDSKIISNDRKIFDLEKKILDSDCASYVMCVSMEKYNELYNKFGKNMNILLGWMHSCSLKNALKIRRVKWGMLDQFSKRPIVQTFLKDDSFELRMRTKAESDPIVAAASILARAEYSRRINILSEQAGFSIKKGAGKITVKQADDIVKKFGHEALSKFVKTHFSTSPKS